MNVATDGAYNLKILNDAFEGRAHENEEIELIKVGEEMKIKKKTKRPPKPEPKKKTSDMDREERLNAIMDEVMRKSHQDFKAIDEEFDRKAKEEEEAKNSMALVPVTYEHQKKARNELLKAKAKAMGGGSTKGAAGKVLFDIDAEGDTFVTGVGIPGKKTKKGKMTIVDPL